MGGGGSTMAVGGGQVDRHRIVELSRPDVIGGSVLSETGSDLLRQDGAMGAIGAVIGRSGVVALTVDHEVSSQIGGRHNGDLGRMVRMIAVLPQQGQRLC